MQLSKGALSSMVFQKTENLQPIFQILKVLPLNSSAGIKARVEVTDGETQQNVVFAEKPAELVSGLDAVGKYVQILEYNVTTAAAPNGTSRNMVVVLSVNFDFAHGAARPLQPISVPAAHAPAAAAYGGTGPVVRTTGMGGAGGAPSASSYTPIDKLNPYSNRWTLRARVTSKGDVKTWDNAKGSGKLMKILIMDESAEIDAVFFKAGVDKYDSLLKVGSLYAFSGGQVKAANQQYSKGRQYEISFDEKAQVTAVAEDGRIGAIRYAFVPLREVAVAEVKASLDVIGILADVKEATEITAKASGKQLTKREITLADDSGVRVDLTLWGTTATSFPGQVGEPCAIKGVTVSDWNGRSLGCSFGAVLQSGAECQNMPRAGELQMWWNNGGQSNGLENLSAGRGSGGGAEGGATGPLADHTQRGTIGEMRSSDPASGDGLPLDEGKLWILKATVAFIKQGGDGDRGPWYYACTNPRDNGRMCNKKCEPNGDSSYSCRDCGPTTMACRWIMSMQLSDHTGSTWATAFDEQAEIIMKGKADAFQAMLTQQGPDSPEYKVPYEHALFSEWLFTCKNKIEEVKGEQRLKTSIIKVRPLDKGEQLLKDVKADIAAIKLWLKS